MFAAAQDKDGVHRLSIRRIRLITGFMDTNGERQDIRFSSRAKAKELADHLNLLGWYDNHFDLHTGLPLPSVSGHYASLYHKEILNLIRERAIVSPDTGKKE